MQKVLHVFSDRFDAEMALGVKIPYLKDYIEFNGELVHVAFRHDVPSLRGRCFDEVNIHFNPTLEEEAEIKRLVR